MTSPAVTVALFESVGRSCASLFNGTGTCSDMSYLGDGGGQGGGSFNNTKISTGNIGQPIRTGGNYDTTYPNGRHTDGSNYLLADGHCKYLKGALVSPGAFPGKLGCDQNSAGCNNPYIGGNVTSASTDMMGVGAKSFAITFSQL